MSLPASIQAQLNEFASKLSRFILTNDYPSIQGALTQMMDALAGALEVHTGTADPSAGAGVEANVGDLYLRDTPGVDGGQLWLKAGEHDTDWTLVNTVAGTNLTDGHIFVGNAGNIATGVVMGGEASIVAAGTVTLSNAAVIGKVLTGFVSGVGVVLATDTILQALNKIDGNEIAGHALASAALPSASFTDAAVTGKLITGFVSGAGAVGAGDTILQALNKLDGNVILNNKLSAGYVAGAGVVAVGDSIEEAIEKLDGNISSVASIETYKRIRVTKTFADFVASDFTKTITLGVLPAGAAIRDVYANLTAAFTSPLGTEPFTTNGTTEGSFEIADPTGFSADDYLAISSTAPLATNGYVERIYLGAGAAVYDELVTIAGTAGGDIWVEDGSAISVGDYLAIENAGPADIIHVVVNTVADDTITTGTPADGTLTALGVGAGGVVDGQTFTINDGAADYTFEFDTDGSAPANAVTVIAGAPASGTLTAQPVGTGSVVDGQTFSIDAGGGPVTFEFDSDGSAPANAVTVIAAGPAVGDLTVLGAWAIGTPGVVVGQKFTISDGVTPYEFEFALAAGALANPVIITDEGTAATGELVCVGAASLADGQTFTIDDGINPAATFEFDLGGGGVGAGNEPIVYVGTESAHEMATLIEAAINTPSVVTLNITCSGAPATHLALVNQFPGATGNIAITEVVGGGTTLNPTGMAGGLDGDNAATIFAAIAAAIAAANIAGLGVTSGGASPAMTLVNAADGTAGNVAITEDLTAPSATSLTPVGMHLGTDNDDVAAVKAAIILAINTAAMGVTASPGAGAVVNIVNDTDGTAGNIAITENAGPVPPAGVLAPTGMLGGVDADDAAAVHAAILAAIAVANIAGCTVTAAPGGSPVVTLTNTVNGAVGNVAISEVLGGGTTLNPVGMANGADSWLINVQDNLGLTGAPVTLVAYAPAAGTRVYSITETMMHVTAAAAGAGGDVDLSLYLVADTAQIDRGVTACVIEVGPTGTTNRYLVAARDVFTAPTTFMAAADKGAVLTTAGLTTVEDFAAPVNVLCKMDSTGGWLSELTAGSIDFYIDYTVA